MSPHNPHSRPACHRCSPTVPKMIRTEPYHSMKAKHGWDAVAEAIKLLILSNSTLGRGGRTRTGAATSREMVSLVSLVCGLSGLWSLWAPVSYVKLASIDAADRWT